VLTTGAEVAGYRIDRVIGTGPRGTTYLARNPDLTGDAALTIINADLLDAPGFRDRFTRDAEIAAGLTHPGISAVYGHGTTDDGLSWIATRYVAGTDAETALRQGTMTPAKAVRIASEIALTLDYAHRRGLVHRDVRPANFLLSTDDPAVYVVLSSFGNAQPAEYADAAALMSAITYSAPEVLSGQTVDGRADLYSLGCSLYRLLTGRTPFPAAEDPATAVQQHLQAPPPKVTDVTPRLPSALNAVVATAMAKIPDARYQTGEEFAAALTAILPSQQPPSVTPPVPTPPVRREPRPAPAPRPSWHPDPDVEPPDPGQPAGSPPDGSRPGRNPLAVGAAVLTAVGLVVGGGIWLAFRDSDGPAPAAGPRTSSTTSTGATTTTTQPSAAAATRDPAAEATLRGLLPAGYATDACVPTDPTDGARAAFVCAPNRDPGGPTTARYSLFPSQDALLRDFNKRVADSATVICPGNIMSPGAWRHNATPQQVAGTVFCATNGTEPLVAWTTDDKLLLSTVSSTDKAPTLEQLFAWWGSHS
jgi:serine/threonine-protein kinase